MNLVLVREEVTLRLVLGGRTQTGNMSLKRLLSIPSSVRRGVIPKASLVLFKDHVLQVVVCVALDDVCTMRL